MSTRKIKRSNSKDGERSSLGDSGISISDEILKFDNESEDCSFKERASAKKKRPKRWVCAVCEKNFGGGTDLRRHLLIHSDQKPFICKICNKSYRQEINLKNHMTIAHSSEKEFICRFCQKPFSLKLRLKLHLRIHTKEKLYTCSKCPKTFGRNGQLQQHMATCKEIKNNASNKKTRGRKCKKESSVVHDKGKKFECPICEKTIEQDIQMHMESHNPPKRHQCDVCKAEFAMKYQYNVHMRTHTGERPYQCRVCWHSYGHSNVLRLHIRKHTGEKPFQCVLCKDYMAFSQLAHMKTHMKTIHLRDKAYACGACRESFKAKFELEVHMKVCKKSIKAEVAGLVDGKLSVEDTELLSNLRYLIAVLLKKISTKEKLAKLGFEKRLIDHVLIASLKLANRECFISKKLNDLERMKLNIRAFLEWLVPTEVMDGFKKECPSVESILDKIITMYLKKVD